MLILADADGFRLDLNQFRQRVHQPPADRNSPAHGNILIGKFITCQFGCGINRCPAFIDHDNLNFFWQMQSAQKGFCLAPCRAITHSNGCNVKLIAKIYNCFGCLGMAFFRKKRDGFMVEELPLRIQADGFTTCAKTGIDCQDRFLPQGRRKQKLAQIIGKYFDCRLISFFLCCQTDFCFHRHREQSLVTIGTGKSNLICGIVLCFNKERRENIYRLFFRRHYAQRQEFFFLPATHGQNPVGWRR